MSTFYLQGECVRFIVVFLKALRLWCCIKQTGSLMKAPDMPRSLYALCRVGKENDQIMEVAGTIIWTQKSCENMSIPFSRLITTSFPNWRKTTSPLWGLRVSIPTHLQSLLLSTFLLLRLQRRDHGPAGHFDEERRADYSRKL